MSGDYLWDRSGEDPEVARLEGLLGGLAHAAPLGPLPPRRGRRRALLLGGSVVAIAAAVVVAWWVTRAPASSPAGCGAGGAGFAFTARGGAARCGGGATTGGVLPVGTALATPPDVTAEVVVADIGALTLAGGSELTLAATGTAQHRLRLAHGRLSARVTAPPRLFIVDTPAATAIDLGCAYDLAVLPDGRTRLTVTEGVVELAAGPRLAHVTRGHTVTTAADRGPGTPIAVAADPAFAALVGRWDAGDAAALAPLVAAAGAGDTLTLWNLLANAAPAARPAILARLDELFPRPEWLLADELVAGKPEAIAGLRDVLTSGVWLAPVDAPPSPIAPDANPGVWR